MKIALILDARHTAFLSEAQEMNQFLQASTLTDNETEMWLFYGDTKPLLLPHMACPISVVRWIHLPPPALAEQQLALLISVQQRFLADTLVFSSDAGGAELATRLAYRLRSESCVGVTALLGSSGRWQVSKAVYGQQMRLTLALNAASCCLSVAAGGGQAASSGEFEGVEIDENRPALTLPWLVDFEQQTLAADHHLQRAACVLALGQGIGSAAHVHELQTLAGQLGVEIGVSRPVAMNGWSEMSQMLGISGLNIAPQVCIAAGISGAAALMSGIQHSQFIVAINRDPQAAVFAQADVGIVDDLHAVLAELLDCVRASRIREGRSV